MELAGLLSNPRVDRREFSQDPEPIQSIQDPFVDLVRAITDPVFVNGAQKLSGLLKHTKSDKRSGPPKLKPPQGQILRTIKLVLLEQPDGLQTYEARKLVEERLGRKLPNSTVRDALANNRAFERTGRGRYRIRNL